MGKRHKKSNQGRFAGIPLHIMESSAYTELRPLAKALLFELAAQYNGYNNGYLSLTRNDLKARNFKNPNSITDAIKSLEKADLITRIFEGGIANGKGFCHLYALNYQPLNEKLDKPLKKKFAFKDGSHAQLLRDKYSKVSILQREFKKS